MVVSMPSAPAVETTTGGGLIITEEGPFTEAQAADLGGEPHVEGIASCRDWLERAVTYDEASSGCSDGQSVYGTAVDDCGAPSDELTACLG